MISLKERIDEAIAHLKANPIDPDEVAEVIGSVNELLDGAVSLIPDKKIKAIWVFIHPGLMLIQKFIANLDGND